MIGLKKRIRLCPCDSHDVEGIQTWLEDLAGDGLLLEKDGSFCGFFCFLSTPPQAVIYRLIPVQREEASLFSENSPDGDQVEISAEMGWEYLTRYGMFHIYRTGSPAAIELHTDPEVHSLAMNVLRKRLVSNIATMLIWLVVWILLKQSPFGYPFRSAACIGIIFTASFLAWFLLGLLRPVISFFHLRRYQKRLKAGESLTARKEWRKNVPIAILAKLLAVLLPILGVTGAALTLSEAQAQPITADVQVPFVTIADMIPDGAYTQNDSSFGSYNEYRSWSTGAAPVNIEWNEWASITAPDGTSFEGILRVDYHETKNAWLAQQLANDYYQYDRHRYSNFSDLEAPEADVDSILMYSNYLPYIVIRHDNIVIHATLSLTDQTNASVRDLWIRQIVDWLKENP